MRWYMCLILCVAAEATKKGAFVGEWMKVMTPQGPVRGRKDASANLFAFYNIPYATAPTGEDKFKAPLPAPTWTKTYNAINNGVICPQFLLESYIPGDVNVQENCLVANVFVPDTDTQGLPVLVYFHGGGFQFGFGNWIKTKNLMKNKDVIIINFNYRLGIHGFLCLGTEDIPGNAGMKDQVALLRWIQTNIQAFGGNPNDVTIAGYSAGSASVDLLMLSKSAYGLFHKVIPESAASVAAFSVQLDPLQNAKDHAKKLQFPYTDDIRALNDFYRFLSYDDLTAEVFADSPDGSIMFGPCVERNITNDAFLTEPPVTILTKGDYRKVPMLYGFSNMEGLIRQGYLSAWRDRMNEKFSDFLPANLEFKSAKEKAKVAELVKNYYFGHHLINEDNILNIIDYFTDAVFAIPILWAVKLHAEAGHNQVYLYEYSFTDEDTPIVPYTNVRGATHCAQSFAVGDGINVKSSNEDRISSAYKNMKRIIREIWLNFVKTGKPVPAGSSLPTWPAAGADRSPHMSLGQCVELRGRLLGNRVRFWDKIYDEYYRPPIPPRTIKF